MREKYVKYAAACLIFILGDLWIYTSLSGEYKKHIQETTFQQIRLFAMAAPEQEGQSAQWLASAQDFLPGAQVLYFPYDFAADAFAVRAWRHADYEAGMLQYWEQKKDSQEFAKGTESVYYGEIYHPEDTSFYFIPVMDADGFFPVGMLFADYPGADSAYLGLMQALLLGAAAVFLTAYGISLFARDRFVGYGVLALYIIAGIFIAYPLIEALRLTFADGGGPVSLSVWKSVFSQNSMRALAGSLTLGICTATISTILGFLFAFAVERTSIKGKKYIATMANLPIISPPFSLTLSVILLAGNNGLITKQLLHLDSFSIYGLTGLILVQTISMFPIAFMTLQGVLKSIDSTAEDASLDLNASRFHTFMKITLPLALPGILSAWLLVFTNSLADFANPLLLAGSFRVLSVEAYIAVTGRNNFGLGAGLSIMLLLPTLTAFFIQRYWVSRKSFVTVTGKPSARLTELVSPAGRKILAAVVYTIIILITMLYLTIAAGCFVKNWGIDYSFTLENITEALSRGRKSITDTVTLAGIATPIAGILAMITALLIVRKKFAGKRFLEALIMTPYAVPGTLIGIAYVLAFNKQPLILVGTGSILVINYIIRELPVGVENGVATLRQIDPSIEEAAYDLGADSPAVFRTIVLPLIRPAFITSMSYTFVRSMTAVSAIVFLISARWYHITMQIYNFSENLRFGLASVLSTALIIIILAVFGLLRLLVPDQGHTKKNTA